MNKAKVYLIGAGPGDPGLITVRGKELIETCDVVVYDYLANPLLLKYARKDAEIVYVGKMGGNHTKTQEEINQIIVDFCMAGKSVARLKGGDPYIFGRGGEEAQELKKAGLKFEVVPGVTAGSAASAYSGIPLTHRDHTANVAFITGHEDPTKETSNIKWDKIATGIGTLVFYMGIKTLPNIVKNLIENGRSKDTPVAVIRWGTRPDQKTVIGTLSNIAQKVKDAGIKAPAITVVGEVVGLKEELDWFETRPLFGKKIVVTRAREQASDFAKILSSAGAEVIEFPTIECVKPESWNSLDDGIARLGSFDWIIFTSINGVKFFSDRLKDLGKDVRALAGLSICAIGPKTKDGLEKMGLNVDVIPPEYRAESVIESLGAEGVKDKKIFIPRAKIAREILPDELRKMGADVTVAEAYVTVRPEEGTEDLRKMFGEGEISAVTFTSSSTVSNFVKMWKNEEEAKELLEGVTIGSIGPITSETAKGFGFTVDVEPPEYTTKALATGLIEFYAGEKKTEVEV